jgi:hypothetical protein
VGRGALLLVVSVALIGGVANAAGALPGSSTRADPLRHPASVRRSKQGSRSGGRMRSAAIAARLAGAIDRAHSQRQRTRALLAVARVLRWPVVSTGGHVILSGARNMPRNFVLYDFELAATAEAVARGTTFSLEDLAEMLARGGLHPHGKPVSATALRRVLVKTVGAAVHKPAAASSLVPLLLRDLALRRRSNRYDLGSKSVPAAAIRLDPAQALVLVSDLTIGAAHLRKGRSGASGMTAGSAGGRAGRGPGARASSLCNGLGLLKDAITSGKFGIAVIGGLLSKSVRAVVVHIELVHGVVMALFIEAKPTAELSQKTHFGPAGHATDAGKVLEPGVQVWNYSYPPDVFVSCGPLLGIKFPPHGPVPGVQVEWTGAIGLSEFLHAGEMNLEHYGTISYNPADQRTDANGESKLIFTPMNEVIPGFGAVRTGEATGVQAFVHIQSALGNVLGTISNLLFPLNVRYQDLKVTAHVPQGFKFGPTDYSFVQHPESGPNVEVNFAVQGHVCGQDPWSQPWQIAESIEFSSSEGSGAAGANYALMLPKSGALLIPSDVTHSWTLPPPAGPYPANPFNLHLTLTPVQAAFNGSVTPSSIEHTPEVTEDTSCPVPAGWSS